LKNCNQHQKFKSIKNIATTADTDIYTLIYTLNYLKDTPVTPNYLKDTPFSPQLNNGLPLIIFIKTKSCAITGSTIAKTSDTKKSHLWRDIEETIVLNLCDVSESWMPPTYNQEDIWGQANDTSQHYNK